MKIQSTCLILLGIILIAPRVLHGVELPAKPLTLEEIRKGIDLRSERWTVRETSTMRMDADDFASMLLPLSGPESQGESSYQARGFPREITHLDWRDNDGNFITGIRNQGTCGCCWDMAACAVMESAYLIETSDGSGRDFDLSEQHVLSCLDDFGEPGGCGSGSPYNVFRFATAWGMIDEACLPYVGDPDIPCGVHCADANLRTIFFGDQGEVTVNEADTDLIRDALHNIGPLTATMIVYENFRAYSSGIYVASGERTGGHLVTIIGYDADEKYWIAKNSWGEDWGMDGFFHIAWESGCRFASSTRWCEFDPEGSPRARMEVHPDRPLASESVGFFDRSLKVAPGFGEELISWEWDFEGDGQWDVQGRGPHYVAFPEAGVFHPQLRVTDAAGKVGLTEVLLEVDLLGMDPPDPNRYVLHACFPNPFNADTRIVYDLPLDGANVKLAIYDLKGRRLRLLKDAWMSEGRHSQNFDGRDDAGEILASGVYLYRLDADGFSRTLKMSLLQ